MLSHTMRFKSFQDKRIAVDWINENIEPDDLDECLTELKVAFFTGVTPSKNTVKRLLALSHSSYESHDY